MYTHFITRPFRILPRRTSEITRTYYNISSVSIILDREILPFETKNYCQSFSSRSLLSSPYSYAVFASSSSYFSTPATFVKIPESQRDRGGKRATIRSNGPRLCILHFFSKNLEPPLSRGLFIKIARVTTYVKFFAIFPLYRGPLLTLGTAGPTTPPVIHRMNNFRAIVIAKFNPKMNEVPPRMPLHDLDD